MTVHNYHPLATARGVLSEHCPRCTTMLVCHLDQEHLATLQIEQDGLAPHIRTVLWETAAIKVQRAYIRAERAQGDLATAEWMDEAATANQGLD